MRQLGRPPEIDARMYRLVTQVLKSRGFASVDAGGSTGGKDFLERIVGLIRATGYVVAIFSHETRPTAIANIMLEVGFALMCGKPLIIVKSEQAEAPSDITRTDWIVYNPQREEEFKKKVGQAIDDIESLAEYEATLLSVALHARSMDCAIAFERVNKSFLLSGESRFIEAAKTILERLNKISADSEISDIERLRSEVEAFILQAQRASLGKATL